MSLGLGLEGPSIGLGLEPLSLGLGLEGPSLGLGLSLGCLSLDCILIACYSKIIANLLLQDHLRIVTIDRLQRTVRGHGEYTARWNTVMQTYHVTYRVHPH